MSGDASVEKIREILLEPDFSRVLNRVSKLENSLSAVDLDAVETLKKEVADIRKEITALASNIEDVKGVLVGFNKKLTGAFSVFKGE